MCETVTADFATLNNSDIHEKLGIYDKRSRNDIEHENNNGFQRVLNTHEEEPLSFLSCSPTSQDILDPTTLSPLLPEAPRTLSAGDCGDGNNTHQKSLSQIEFSPKVSEDKDELKVSSSLLFASSNVIEPFLSSEVDREDKGVATSAVGGSKHRSVTSTVQESVPDNALYSKAVAANVIYSEKNRKNLGIEEDSSQTKASFLNSATIVKEISNPTISQLKEDLVDNNKGHCSESAKASSKSSNRGARCEAVRPVHQVVIDSVQGRPSEAVCKESPSGHLDVSTSDVITEYFSGLLGALQAVLFIMIAMGDIAARRALSQGGRLLQHTRSLFTTTPSRDPTATISNPSGTAAAVASSENQATTEVTSSASSEEEEGATSTTGSGRLRSYMELPGPRGWPVLGSFPEYFKKENQGQMHELMRRRHKQYGRMFKEQFGPRHNVVVADPTLIEELLRKEGRYPSRPPYESWVVYNQMRQRSGGLMTSENEYWRRSRSTMAPKLRPKAVNEYVGGMNQVCQDLVDRLGHLRDPSTHTVPRLLNELNKFTMETILYVMLNKRVGCMDRELSERVDSFIKSIATMFLTGHQLMVYARLHKWLGTRPWRQHVQSWDKIYGFAAELIHQRIEEVRRELESGSPPVEGEHVDFMKYVVGTHQLSDNEIVDNVIEIFMGGIDTTANSLAFLFYLLSKHTSVQARLVEEVDTVLGRRQADSSDLQNMPYLKACVKETLRLFPPIPMNARTTTEDITLGGFRIPKDTILMLNSYVMARDETIFPEPDEFKPDRWLRGSSPGDSTVTPPHPFALLPFGFGTRGCVGRRIAETQIYLATTQVLQRYWLKKSDAFDIKPQVRTQLTPGPELPVIFVER